MATKLQTIIRIFFSSCLLFSVPVRAEQESRIHSETRINDAHDGPVNTRSKAEGKQEEQERPVSDPSDFLIGPFDREGNFNHRTKKEDTAPGT